MPFGLISKLEKFKGVSTNGMTQLTIDFPFWRPIPFYGVGRKERRRKASQTAPSFVNSSFEPLETQVMFASTMLSVGTFR